MYSHPAQFKKNFFKKIQFGHDSHCLYEFLYFINYQLKQMTLGNYLYGLKWSGKKYPT
jgi:hypothetical protein